MTSAARQIYKSTIKACLASPETRGLVVFSKTSVFLLGYWEELDSAAGSYLAVGAHRGMLDSSLVLVPQTHAPSSHGTSQWQGCHCSSTSSSPLCALDDICVLITCSSQRKSKVWIISWERLSFFRISASHAYTAGKGSVRSWTQLRGRLDPEHNFTSNRFERRTAHASEMVSGLLNRNSMYFSW